VQELCSKFLFRLSLSFDPIDTAESRLEIFEAAVFFVFKIKVSLAKSLVAIFANRTSRFHLQQKQDKSFGRLQQLQREKNMSRICALSQAIRIYTYL